MKDHYNFGSNSHENHPTILSLRSPSRGGSAALCRSDAPWLVGFGGVLQAWVAMQSLWVGTSGRLARDLTKHWSRRPTAYAPLSLRLLGAAQRQRSAPVE